MNEYLLSELKKKSNNTDLIVGFGIIYLTTG